MALQISKGDKPTLDDDGGDDDEDEDDFGYKSHFLLYSS